MKFHHVAISIQNSPETIRWYEDVFEMTIVRSIEREDLGVTVHFMKGNDLQLEIFCFDKVSPIPEYRKTIDSDIRVCGTKHFAFEVTDIKKAINRAISAGSTTIEGPHSSFDSKNLYAFVTDPSGTLVEFLEFL